MEIITPLKHDASLDYTIPPSSVVLATQVIRTIRGISVNDGSLDYASPKEIKVSAVLSRDPSVPKGITNDASFDYQ